MTSSAKQSHHVETNNVSKSNDDDSLSVLNEKVVGHVTRTWKLVAQDPVKHGVTLYNRLFTTHPEVKAMFSFGSKETSEDVIKQAEILTNMIDFAVRNMDNLAALVPELKKAGVRHFVNYHVKPEQFQVVGECLLWTLQQGLADLFTEEVKQAWITVFGIVSKTMIQAGTEALVANDNNKSGPKEQGALTFKAI